MTPVRLGIIETLIPPFNVAFAVKRAEMGWTIRIMMSEFVDGQEKTVACNITSLQTKITHYLTRIYPDYCSPSPKIAYPGKVDTSSG